MKKALAVLTCVVLAGTIASHRTQAQGKVGWTFQRVGTFANYANAALGETTVSEIVAATADGKTLVYTDAERGTIGFIDITNPSKPVAAGALAIDPDPHTAPSYSPTSVAVLRNQYVLVAADTSGSKKAASGELVVVDLATRAVVRRLDMGGQPDSIKVSPDHRFLAVVIENERDESLCVGGTQNDKQVSSGSCSAGGGALGVMPQNQLGNPAGYLAVIQTAGAPASWVRQDVHLTNLPGLLYPGDPEPEFVDVNQKNQAVVTLQENNHIVVVDLPSRTIVTHFSAGDVDLTKIDTQRAGTGVPNTIALVNTQNDRLREPDAVTWVGDRIATANEGDLSGGSRGFTMFNLDGSVAFDSGNTLEHLAVRFGHYPERRSNAKGTEPESILAAKYGPTDVLFVGSERGSFVAVYQLDRNGLPTFAQLLPAPLGPEGLLAIPQRNLLVASGENDAPPFGVRSTVQIYELRSGEAPYPQLYSMNDAAGTPIPWSALSGMTEVLSADGSIETGNVQAIWDSFFTPTRVFTIDVTRTPAVITNALTINGGTASAGLSAYYDPEGLAYAPDGSLWIASEGNADDSRPNRLIQVNPATGNLLQPEVGLPAAALACRSAERALTGNGALGSGFEGLDIARTPGGGYLIYVAQQRGWNYTSSDACAAIDDDPNDGGLAGGTNTETAWTRIWVYDPQLGTWTHLPYEFEPKPVNAAWIGLSEITLTDTGWILIERDNLTGDFGIHKTLVHLPLLAGGDGAFTRDEKGIFNLRPPMTATNGWITDKPEGVAVLPGGHLFVVTDNDGVDGWSGETSFLRLGPYVPLFQ